MQQIEFDVDLFPHILQLCQMKTAHLLNKYYWNEDILSGWNTLKVLLDSWTDIESTKEV